MWWWENEKIKACRKVTSISLLHLKTKDNLIIICYIVQREEINKVKIFNPAHHPIKKIYNSLVFYSCMFTQFSQKCCSLHK